MNPTSCERDTVAKYCQFLDLHNQYRKANLNGTGYSFTRTCVPGIEKGSLVKHKPYSIKDMRFLAFIDERCHTLGLNRAEFGKIVQDRLYVGRGWDPLPHETLRKYISGDRTPRIEASLAGKPGLVTAIDIAFPGSTITPFHPCWNMLGGELRSRKKILDFEREDENKWLTFLKETKLITTSTFEEELNGRGSLNRHDQIKHTKISELHRVHKCLLQLPLQLITLLFKLEPRTDYFCRRYRSIKQEVSYIKKYSIRKIPGAQFDALTAGIGLILEAIEISDQKRLEYAKQFVADQLQYIKFNPAFKRIAKDFISYVDQRCIQVNINLWSLRDAVRQAYPHGWKTFGNYSYETAINDLIVLKYMKQGQLRELNKMIPGWHASRNTPSLKRKNLGRRK